MPENATRFGDPIEEPSGATATRFGDSVSATGALSPIEKLRNILAQGSTRGPGYYDLENQPHFDFPPWLKNTGMVIGALELGTGLISKFAPSIAEGASEFLSNESTEAPEAASRLRDIGSKILSHPKVQSALKDAAIEATKEIPGVKTAIKVGKIASSVSDAMQESAPTATATPAPSSVPSMPVARPLQAIPEAITHPPFAENAPFSPSRVARQLSGKGTLAESEIKIDPSSPLARNPKALAIAKQLQEEMAMPSVGSTVTLRNGTTGVIKAIHPDGSFDYE